MGHLSSGLDNGDFESKSPSSLWIFPITASAFGDGGFHISFSSCVLGQEHWRFSAQTDGSQIVHCCVKRFNATPLGLRAFLAQRGRTAE